MCQIRNSRADGLFKKSSCNLGLLLTLLPTSEIVFSSRSICVVRKAGNARVSNIFFGESVFAVAKVRFHSHRNEFSLQKVPNIPDFGLLDEV